MDFSDALKELGHGKKISRRGWNGKGMYLFLANGAPLPGAVPSANRPYIELLGNPEPGLPVLPAVCMRTATGAILVGWLASQTDMLSGDWEVC